MFKSVLVVCVGNICRSPVGERLLSSALPGLKIASAGLDAMVGEAADSDAFAAAAEQGVDLSGHVGRLLTPELGAGYDLILVMEKSHRNDIARRMPQLVGRTMLFGQWIDGGVDIPDPYRHSRGTHDRTVALIRRAGEAWVPRLKVKE